MNNYDNSVELPEDLLTKKISICERCDKTGLPEKLKRTQSEMCLKLNINEKVKYSRKYGKHRIPK